LADLAPAVDAPELASLRRWCRAPALGAAPHVLAVVAHPDDELLGFGGRMSHVAPQLHVAYVSDGAPDDERFYRPLGFERRHDYALARRAEARRGLALAGMVQSQVHELGVVDQHVTSALERVVEWLLALITRVRPEAVLTHPYEGGHPDHDATACAVHVALRRLGFGQGRLLPLWEFTSYHARGTELIRGQFIPDTSQAEERVQLDDATREFKLRLLDCHATQREFLWTFPVEEEHFRLAPEYDFSQPPAAPFFYDRMDWGVSGAAFLLAARQLHRLYGLTGPC
jgi:LmbE family N-acetylglucosaminyl deacetylase